MEEATAFGQEEDHLATYLRGRDLAGTLAEALAGGCLAIRGTMLFHTMRHMLELLLCIGTRHTTLTLTIGGEALN
jgi:hypothetical protein